jgi:hypothetical protein
VSVLVEQANRMFDFRGLEVAAFSVTCCLWVKRQTNHSAWFWFHSPRPEDVLLPEMATAERSELSVAILRKWHLFTTGKQHQKIGAVGTYANFIFAAMAESFSVSAKSGW